MLTYAGAKAPSDVLVRNLKQTSRYIDHVLAYDYSAVFDGGELVFVFDNIPFWKKRGDDFTIWHLPRWGRRMERHIRLVIKLRARYSRLRAKLRCDTAPQKQSTSEARPAA